MFKLDRLFDMFLFQVIHSLNEAAKNQDNSFDPIHEITVKDEHTQTVHIMNEKVAEFISDRFLNEGLPSCKEACEILDLTDSILIDRIPGYKGIMIEGLQITADPNKRYTVDTSSSKTLNSEFE